MNYRDIQELLDEEQFVKPMGATLALKFNSTEEYGQAVLLCVASLIDATFADKSIELGIDELEDRTTHAALNMSKGQFNHMVLLYNQTNLEESYKNSPGFMG